MKHLILIGTSHIVAQSIREVAEAIDANSPAVVCLEIDAKRIRGLFEKTSAKRASWKRIGIKGYLFALIGAWAERKLGDLVGVSPGEEMRTAIMHARKKGIPIALIDQDIEITLKRLSETLSWIEKWRFVLDILKALGRAVIRKPEFEFDIRKVPEEQLIKKLMAKVKDRYPNVYKVLIEERNRHMASELEKILAQHPDKKVVAVVGAGHKEGISLLLKSHRPGESDISYSVSIEAQ